MYAHAVKTLSDKDMTTLILVSRPEKAPLDEAARASKELSDIGVNNQKLIINGVLEKVNTNDPVSESFLKSSKRLWREFLNL